jgi:hypothetical protein
MEENTVTGSSYNIFLTILIPTSSFLLFGAESFVFLFSIQKFKDIGVEENIWA